MFLVLHLKKNKIRVGNLLNHWSPIQFTVYSHIFIKCTQYIITVEELLMFYKASFQKIRLIDVCCCCRVNEKKIKIYKETKTLIWFIGLMMLLKAGL